MPYSNPEKRKEYERNRPKRVRPKRKHTVEQLARYREKNRKKNNIPPERFAENRASRHLWNGALNTTLNMAQSVCE